MRMPYSRVLGVVSGLAGLGAIATLSAAGIGVAVVAFLVAGTANPAARFLTLGCTASALIWAIFLLWLARELGKPEYRQESQAGALY